MKAHLVYVPPAEGFTKYEIRSFCCGTGEPLPRGRSLAEVTLLGKKGASKAVKVAAPSSGVLVFSRDNVASPHAIDVLLAVVDQGARYSPRELLERTFSLATEHGVPGNFKGIELEVSAVVDGGSELEVWVHETDPLGQIDHFSGDLGTFPNPDEGLIEECLLWAKATCKRRKLPSPTLKREQRDDRGMPERLITHVPSPDGSYDLELTFAVEPPWGAPYFTIRILRIPECSVIRDEGETLYYQPDQKDVWKRIRGGWRLELSPREGRKRTVIELED